MIGLSLLLIVATATCSDATSDKTSAAPAPKLEILFPAILEASNATVWNATPTMLADGCKWGYIDSAGKTRFPASFIGACEFHEGRALVTVDNKCGYIDSNGTLVIPAKYDMARDFSEGRAAVRDGAGHWGFIDKKGRVVVELKFADVTDFSEGLAGIDPLQIRPGLTGFVDRDGRIVIKPQFYVAYQFSCGLARVFDRPEIGMRPINTRFIRHDGSVAFLVDQSYTLTSEFHDGLAVIRKNDKYGYLNTKGKIAVQAIYDDADSMREGLAAVKVGDLWGFIDNSGKRCIKPTFIGKHDAPAFSEGYAFVTTSSGWRGFINKNGKQVLADTMGRDYGMFKNGLVVFSKATPTNKVKNIYQYEFGYMKQDGEVVFIKTFLATGLN